MDEQHALVEEPGGTSAGDDLLDVAREAVDLAAAYLLGNGPGSVVTKSDRDMASDADFAVEELVRSFLAGRTPGIGFRGEETGVSGPDGDQWVLDPVDGTANYLHGMPLCAVSLALCRARRPVVGVIGLPFLGRRYWAAAGRGAFRDGRPVTAGGRVLLSEAIVAVGDYGTGPGAAARNRLDHALHRGLAPAVQRVRMLGSAAVDLAWVADGTLDASITLSNRPWDIAAGVIIAREAGACVVDADGTPHTADSAVTVAVARGLRDQLTAVVGAALSGAGTPDPATAPPAVRPPPSR